MLHNFAKLIWNNLNTSCGSYRWFVFINLPAREMLFEDFPNPPREQAFAARCPAGATERAEKCRIRPIAKLWGTQRLVTAFTLVTCWPNAINHKVLFLDQSVKFSWSICSCMSTCIYVLGAYTEFLFMSTGLLSILGRSCRFAVSVTLVRNFSK